MADCEDADNDLDALLDSAIEDFRKVADKKTQPSLNESQVPPANEKFEVPLGQGLGIGLPTLTPGKRRSGITKGRVSTTNQFEASASRSSVAGSSKSSVAATLEKLAAQTRQAVESMEPRVCDEDAMGNQLVEDLVKQFEGMGGSQNMQSMMDTMMHQLLSKDILHEPMKEIGERYPEWLESNKSKLSSEDYARYSRQHQFIMQLCNVYDTTPDDFQKIVDLMQNMQDCGQPPSDIVRELAPGLELGEDGLPVLPELALAGAEGDKGNCTIM